MSVKNIYDVIKKPLITEKSTILAEQGKYVFEVSQSSSKSVIQKAVEQIFVVKVKAVNIINQLGKQKRFKGRVGRRVDVKKAVVTLEKDNSIDLAGGVK